MATKSTEEHEKIVLKAFIFPCSSVDFVAINNRSGAQPDLALVISLKE